MMLKSQVVPITTIAIYTKLDRNENQNNGTEYPKKLTVPFLICESLPVGISRTADPF